MVLFLKSKKVFVSINKFETNALFSQEIGYRQDT